MASGDWASTFFLSGIVCWVTLKPEHTNLTRPPLERIRVSRLFQACIASACPDKIGISLPQSQHRHFYCSRILPWQQSPHLPLPRTSTLSVTLRRHPGVVEHEEGEREWKKKGWPCLSQKWPYKHKQISDEKARIAWPGSRQLVERCVCAGRAHPVWDTSPSLISCRGTSRDQSR
jgi:hypothetical protein